MKNGKIFHENGEVQLEFNAMYLLDLESKYWGKNVLIWFPPCVSDEEKFTSLRPENRFAASSVAFRTCMTSDGKIKMFSTAKELYFLKEIKPKENTNTPQPAKKKKNKIHVKGNNPYLGQKPSKNYGLFGEYIYKNLVPAKDEQGNIWFIKGGKLHRQYKYNAQSDHVEMCFISKCAKFVRWYPCFMQEKFFPVPFDFGAMCTIARRILREEEEFKEKMQAKKLVEAYHKAYPNFCEEFNDIVFIRQAAAYNMMLNCYRKDLPPFIENLNKQIYLLGDH